MQFSVVALAAFVASASAAYVNGTGAVVVTQVVTDYTTYCPAATELTFNGKTYTVTTATTLTITDCPCTIVKPVVTSSVVYCNTCAPTSAPVYANSTTAAVTKSAVGTTSSKVSATATPTALIANGATQAMAFSGASLAGLLGLAAYIL